MNEHEPSVCQPPSTMATKEFDNAPKPLSGIEGRWVPMAQFRRENPHRKKSFGHFKCTCGVTWVSAHAFVRHYGQECRTCDRTSRPKWLWENLVVVPKEERDTHKDGGPPHRADLCEACRAGVCQLTERD